MKENTVENINLHDENLHDENEKNESTSLMKINENSCSLKTRSQLCDLSCHLDHVHRYFTHELIRLGAVGSCVRNDSHLSGEPKKLPLRKMIPEQVIVNFPSDIGVQTMNPNGEVLRETANKISDTLMSSIRSDEIGEGDLGLKKHEECSMNRSENNLVMRKQSHLVSVDKNGCQNDNLNTQLLVSDKPVVGEYDGVIDDKDCNRYKALGEHNKDPIVVNQAMLTTKVPIFDDKVVNSDIKALGNLTPTEVPVDMNQAIMVKNPMKTEDQLHCSEFKALGKSFSNEVPTNMNQAMLTSDSQKVGCQVGSSWIKSLGKIKSDPTQLSDQKSILPNKAANRLSTVNQRSLAQTSTLDRHPGENARVSAQIFDQQSGLSRRNLNNVVSLRSQSVSCQEKSREVVNSNTSPHLRNVKSVKLSPKSVKRKTVTRGEVKLKSPKSPRCKIKFKKAVASVKQQRHLVTPKKDEQSVVSKLIATFEHNQDSMNCFTVKHDIRTEIDHTNIKKGAVKDAFEMLMLHRGADSKIRTPKGKNVKRLYVKKTTSSQKKLDSWLRN